MESAIFLTLDDTLIKNLSGREYSTHLEDWKFNNTTLNLLYDYIITDHSRICIICNQPAIYNNIIKEKDFVIKMNTVVDILEKRIIRKLKDNRTISNLKIKSNFISYSYTIDNTSYYYLPKPGLLYSLALDFELDLYKSVFIGSNEYDKSASILAGIKTYIDVSFKS